MIGQLMEASQSFDTNYTRFSSQKKLEKNRQMKKKMRNFITSHPLSMMTKSLFSTVYCWKCDFFFGVRTIFSIQWSSVKSAGMLLKCSRKKSSIWDGIPVSEKSFVTIVWRRVDEEKKEDSARFFAWELWTSYFFFHRSIVYSCNIAT